jgi:sulfatase modifying factor 1
MGSTTGNDDEKPVHTVTITNDFYIGKYEVVQAEWKEVMGSNPSKWKGDNLPVEQVNWYDTVEFCNRLSDREGLTRCYSGSGESDREGLISCYGGSGENIRCNFKANGYRLPKEAEWEYAALGGNRSRGYTYSGSNSAFDVGWYDDNVGGKTHPVGEKNANELGLYDMSGNVWEWCWDWYDENYYSSSAQTDPCWPSRGEFRVFRGGSWDNIDGARAVRVSYRYRHGCGPGFRRGNSGFRLCRGK